MRAETIHLFALIAMRALADCDPVEFRRSTDLSKRELDKRIAMLLSGAHVKNDERLLSEAKDRMESLQAIELESESQTELSFLLRQLSHSSRERAHQLALKYSRDVGARVSGPPSTSIRPATLSEGRGVTREEEFLRLGVMRLVRELPGYFPRFGYRFRNMEIDCFLEPSDDEIPPIIIELKMLIRSEAETQAVERHLKEITAGWGKNVLATVLTASAEKDVTPQEQRPGGKFFLLSYNSESNEFAPRNLAIFMDAIRAHTQPNS